MAEESKGGGTKGIQRDGKRLPMRDKGPVPLLVAG